MMYRSCRPRRGNVEDIQVGGGYDVGVKRAGITPLPEVRLTLIVGPACACIVAKLMVYVGDLALVMGDA